ncbi:HlyD family type I secretion periplasmic adaptor subunit [Skermanella mucosa]|uniref:HlyD family type I secretion periplasmic adaptor subunit n=1 Tax=Skermanella mucosa TaxID=1789672 RepID=UPI00192ADD12|nr:HlyD family type I secretion periplasmic adaptor subunit [Skermanella mucosa]UEM21554.1 HlyD family type I secretion periplasmic adaptor subunit [Skermanella mucosa]
MTSLIETNPGLLPAKPAAGRGAKAKPNFPTSYNGTITAGWLVILAGFGSLAAWSALAPLSTAAIASGTVVVDSYRKSVQHLQGGIIQDILVRDGQKVQAGDVLVRLDPTQTRSLAQMLRAQVDLAKAEEARMLAERDGLPDIRFPADMIERARTERDLAETMAGQKRIFEARRESLIGQTSILRNRIAQSLEQINGMEIQEKAKLRQSALLDKELNGLRELADRGNAPANKVLQYEREVEELTAERGEILSRIASVRQQIGEAELQITQAQKTFLEQVETDLRTTQARLFESAERLHATTAELSRMEVRAPETGVVVDMAFHTVDGVISPGGRIMDIVPQNDQLVVDAQIRPADIDGLQVGMEAEIRFPAFNQRTTPMIHGQLKTVSADRLVDPKTNMPYFNVRVLVDEKSKQSISGLNIIPGMPAEVVIKKGERTLLSYLIQPMQDTFVRAMRE